MIVDIHRRALFDDSLRVLNLWEQRGRKSDKLSVITHTIWKFIFGCKWLQNHSAELWPLRLDFLISVSRIMTAQTRLFHFGITELSPRRLHFLFSASRIMTAFSAVIIRFAQPNYDRIRRFCGGIRWGNAENISLWNL